MIGLENPWAAAGGIAFCVALAFWHYRCRDWISDRLVPLSGLERRLPWRSAQLVLRIPFYGIPGIAAYSLLYFLRPDLVLPGRFTSTVVPFGLLLGAALMVSSSALANAMFVTAFHLRRGDPRQAKTELRVAKDSGWIRAYTIAYRSLPLPLFALIATISVAGEELAFRGVLLPLLMRGFGTIPGAVLSVAAFVAIQKPFMPSWISATVPMAGALVVGSVLTWMAITKPNIVFLIMAHVGFLFLTMLVFLAWDRGPWVPTRTSSV